MTESLEEHMAWLYDRRGVPRCLCRSAIRPLGVLHGINMGKGWVRIDTHPECPHHALCQGYTAQVRASRDNGRWLNCCIHGTRDCYLG